MRIERWWRSAPLRIKSLFRRGRVEQELDEELRFHLDHKIEEGIARGLSSEEARRQALLAMGGLDQRKEEMRDTQRVHWLTDFVDDVRYAFRSLRRTPGLTAFIVITIAVGIGMTAAPFSMLDALVFRPYPVPDSWGVVTLVGTTREKSYDNFSYREYLDIRNHTKSYSGVIANGPLSGVAFSTRPRETPRVRSGILVSGNYFKVLGVEPRLGRGFREDEDRVPGRDAVVVLGPDFWKHEFAGDPNVINRVIRLNGADFTIIGVAPESFPGMFIFYRPDFYMPLAMARTFSTDRQKNFFVDRDDRELTVRARLKPGATVGGANNELTVLASGFERDYPKTNRDRGAAVRTQLEMRTRGDDVNWKFGVIINILALAVLAVACLNVAGLLLSRASTRTREIAIRLAIGAGRFRIVRLLLAESLVLAILGGLGGVAVGYASLSFLTRFQLPVELPTQIPFRMDMRVLLATVVLSLLSALVCGLAPALQSTRTDLVNGLKAGEGEQPGRKRLWGRNVLVVAQIATSLMLLAASFLMYRFFHAEIGEGAGFAKDHLLMVRFDPRLVQYDEAQTRHFYDLLTERVRELPGVRSAALTRNPPLGFDPYEILSFVPDGFVMPRGRESFTSMMDSVDPPYFETLGVPILRGRPFLRSDTADSGRVAIVNESFAKHYWPNGDALGKRLRLESAAGPAVEIVGIARPVKYRDTTNKPVDFVYMPLAQHPAPRLVLLLRTNVEPLQMVGPVKDIVRTLDSNMPISETRSFEDIYRYHFVDGPGVAIGMVGLLGAIALLLAVAGLYGLVAYNVSRRTREIGIRMAIGAAPSDVLRLMMRKGLVLAATGSAIGLAMGFAVERLMNAMIFDAGGVDLLVYLVVVPTMIAVTMLAAYVPARKASRIAPTIALRYE